MAEKSKKPAIRFMGYSDTLKSRKLGDLCLIGDIDHKMPQSVIDGIPYIMTGDFIGTNELNFENTKQISTEDYEQLSKKIKPEAGDILFARYASVGAVRYVETQRKFLVSYSCAILKNGEAANGKYLFYFLQANGTQRQIELEINTGSQRNIGIDSLKKLNILLPEEREQEEVAIFLTNIDNLIIIHQRKYNKLVTVKKAMLKKMFPQNGALVPEIRFKGFTEAWEERNFGEVFNYERPDNYIVENSEYSDMFDTPVLTANKGFILGYTNETRTCNNQSIIFDDFTLDSKYIDFPYMVKSSAIKILTVTDNNKYNLRFAFELLKSAKIDIMGHARHYISVVQSTDVFVPKILEQNKICKLFSALDTIISLQENKVEKLKKIKKAFLEKMFV